MNIKEKSLAVLSLYKELEAEATKYASEGGLSCLSGCGFCCANPKIPATILEFLPLAFELYEKGAAEASLRIIESNPESNCILYRTQDPEGKSGYCSGYAYRGMICRLFGASARRSKSGSKELITCKILKSEKQTEYLKVSEQINQSLEVPMATAYYSYLRDIGASLCEERTVNEAIRLALELVLRYKFYEEGELAAD